MFTYGYIREAVMAHLDIDEEEAQAMNLLSRFHIFANEAMQAICASKPMYQYIDVTVVKKFDPIVTDGSFFRKATEAEINWDEDLFGPNPVKFLSTEETREYYHQQNIYEQFEKVNPGDNFIAFADKQCFKLEPPKLTEEDLFNEESINKKMKADLKKVYAELGHDFDYISRNQIKFYKPGKYLIPAKYVWYRFDSGISDSAEIDMPSDIFLCIPLYIASICLQVDNMQKASVMRNEFELALARCTSGDFMPLNAIRKDW